MANNAFSTQGATPGISTSAINKSTTSLSPKSKALQTIQGITSGFKPQVSSAPVPSIPKAPTVPLSTLNASSTSLSNPQITPPQATQQPTSTGMVKHTITYPHTPETPNTASQGLMNPQYSPSQNTATPMPTTPTQPNATNVTQPMTYSGMVQNNYERAGQPSQQYTDLTNQAQEAYKKAANFGKEVGQAQLDVTTNPEYSIDTGVGLGNRIAQNNGLEMKSLNDTASGLGNLAGLANTQQANQNSALYNNASLRQPVQVPYSNQFIDPTTGQPVGGGANGGNLQQSASSIAQRVQNGEMSYDAGVQALSGYGAMAPQALLGALPQGFNVQASNANAAAQSASIQQTGTLGGQITKAADSANQSLTKLEQDFNKLSSLQTGGIPATNNVANWIASSFGQDALSAYTTTLHDARAQIQGVLSTAGGLTPTGAAEAAQTYLPDNMTPAQFKSKVAAAKELVRQKVSAFTNTSGGSSASTDSTTAGGYGFKLVNGKWIPN